MEYCKKISLSFGAISHDKMYFLSRDIVGFYALDLKNNSLSLIKEYDINTPRPSGYNHLICMENEKIVFCTYDNNINVNVYDVKKNIILDSYIIENGGNCISVNIYKNTIYLLIHNDEHKENIFFTINLFNHRVEKWDDLSRAINRIITINYINCIQIKNDLLYIICPETSKYLVVNINSGEIIVEILQDVDECLLSTFIHNGEIWALTRSNSLINLEKKRPRIIQKCEDGVPNLLIEVYENSGILWGVCAYNIGIFRLIIYDDEQTYKLSLVSENKDGKYCRLTNELYPYLNIVFYNNMMYLLPCSSHDILEFTISEGLITERKVELFHSPKMIKKYIEYQTNQHEMIFEKDMDFELYIRSLIE